MSSLLLLLALLHAPAADDRPRLAPALTRSHAVASDAAALRAPGAPAGLLAVQRPAAGSAGRIAGGLLAPESLSRSQLGAPAALAPLRATLDGAAARPNLLRSKPAAPERFRLGTRFHEAGVDELGTGLLGFDPLADSGFAVGAQWRFSERVALQAEVGHYWMDSDRSLLADVDADRVFAGVSLRMSL